MTGMLTEKDAACLRRMDSRERKWVSLCEPHRYKLVLKSRRWMKLALLKVCKGGKRIPLSEFMESIKGHPSMKIRWCTRLFGSN